MTTSSNLDPSSLGGAPDIGGNDARTRNDSAIKRPLYEALAFFTSVVQSGEPWSPTCEAMREKACAALDDLSARSSSSEEATTQVDHATALYGYAAGLYTIPVEDQFAEEQETTYRWLEGAIDAVLKELRALRLASRSSPSAASEDARDAARYRALREAVARGLAYLAPEEDGPTARTAEELDDVADQCASSSEGTTNG